MNWYKVANSIDVAQWFRDKIKQNNPNLTDQEIEEQVSSINPQELVNDINSSGQGLKAETDGTNVWVSVFEDSESAFGQNMKKVDNLYHAFDELMSNSKYWRNMINKIDKFFTVDRGKDLGKQWYGSVPGA